MRVNAVSLLIRAETTTTSGTLNDLTTDLIMANNNNNIRSGRLRWYGHVMRKGDEDWVKKCMEYRVEGRRPAPNDTAYKRWSCHSELKLLCKLCRTSPPPAMGARFTVFGAWRPCGLAGWLAQLLTKAGDVETNPGPTTLNKKVWIL